MFDFHLILIHGIKLGETSPKLRLRDREWIIFNGSDRMVRAESTFSVSILLFDSSFFAVSSEGEANG